MASLLINAAKLQNINFRKCVTGIQETGHSRHALVNKSSCYEMDSRRSSPCTSIKFFSSSLHPERLWGSPSLRTNGTRARRPKREIEQSWSDAKDRNALRFTSTPLIRVSVFKQRRIGDCTLPTITLVEDSTAKWSNICRTVKQCRWQSADIHTIVCGQLKN